MSQQRHVDCWRPSPVNGNECMAAAAAAAALR